MKQANTLQNTIPIPTDLPTPWFLWLLGAMGTLILIILRMGYKDLLKTQDERNDEKLKAFKEELRLEWKPVLEDVHAIKNHLTGKDGTLLSVHDLMTQINNKLDKIK